MDTLIQLLCLTCGVIVGTFTGILFLAWLIHRDAMRQADEIYQPQPPIPTAQQFPQTEFDKWSPYIMSEPAQEALKSQP